MHSGSLTLARSWYVLAGGGALLLTAGHTFGAITSGSRFDAPLAAAGIGIGAFALAAAAWVVSRSAARAAGAWVGIVVGFAPFGVAGWRAATTASLDAQVLAGVPAMIGVLAAVRMTVARVHASP
ncbi:MAG: hypothetical protein M3406_03875 [Chloroflexota bacterium]|nr:hypothetical protein [Chloroflexota bacterium]